VRLLRLRNARQLRKRVTSQLSGFSMAKTLVPKERPHNICCTQAIGFIDINERNRDLTPTDSVVELRLKLALASGQFAMPYWDHDGTEVRKQGPDCGVRSGSRDCACHRSLQISCALTTAFPRSAVTKFGQLSLIGVITGMRLPFAFFRPLECNWDFSTVIRFGVLCDCVVWHCVASPCPYSQSEPT
jgi:hypothetical protein